MLGTDNVMMAAVLADGITVIEGAATEPEVVDLANFLNKMGAKIEGAGTRRIIIEGVNELHGAEHDVIPDRIEAGTFLVAARSAGKDVTVSRVEPEHVSAVTDALIELPVIKFETTDNSITVSPNGAAKPLELTDPAVSRFPDRHAGADVRACFPRPTGISVITENIFPQRYMHVAELKRMGAQVQLRRSRPRSSRASSILFGAPVMASDLRASAALVLAGLKAEGAQRK